MLKSYMAEAFEREWEGSAEALERDGLGREVRTLVAESGRDLIAFACWRRIYDLHHCALGAEVTDMFVQPKHRGRGLAPSLVAAIAGQIQREGGRFIKGRADAKLERFYRRGAVLSPGSECYVGNRAFAVLARLAGAAPHALARGLPDASLNHQA